MSANPALVTFARSDMFKTLGRPDNCHVAGRNIQPNMPKARMLRSLLLPLNRQAATKLAVECRFIAARTCSRTHDAISRTAGGHAKSYLSEDAAKLCRSQPSGAAMYDLQGRGAQSPAHKPIQVATKRGLP
jgi:hypothetical protein